MLKKAYSVVSLLLLVFLVPYLAMSQDFIQIKGTQFLKNGQPHYFMGANFWYGMNIANSDKERLIRELDHLQALGINNLRVMAASEGPDTAPWRMVPALQVDAGIYNDSLLIGLDFLLVELAKRKMHAVLCLNNMWPWSGGFAQYINWATGKPIPYPPPAAGGKWLKYMKYAAQFFSNKKAQTLYNNHIRHIVNRQNSISGILYREDPTIFSWQLANEPRPVLNNWKYRRWIRNTAAFIKSLDKHHLVSIGSEGNAFLPLSTKFKKEHRINNIDYTTIHIWIQNWGWYDPTQSEKTFQSSLNKAKKYILQHTKIAEKLHKPLVLEEFGIARDLGSYQVDSPTTYRDQYYQEIFSLITTLAQQNEAIAGCNFWAWSGEGRPRMPKAIWKAGDDFTGDPPFEYQGWYSIYDTDLSTLKIIRKHAVDLNSIKK